MVKKIPLIGLALFAVFAFSAMAVTSAALAAPTAEWLESGEPILEPLSIDSQGELLFKDVKQKTDWLCSGLNEGTVGAGGLDTVTNITELTTTSKIILCVFQETGSCEASSSPDLEPLGLPWLTELLLVVEGGVEKFLDDILSSTGGAAGWILLCLVLGFTVSDECGSETGSADIDNNVAEGDVVALFSLAISGSSNCSLGGAGEGEVEGEILILTLSGPSLAVSGG